MAKHAQAEVEMVRHAAHWKTSQKISEAEAEAMRKTETCCNYLARELQDSEARLLHRAARELMSKR